MNPEDITFEEFFAERMKQKGFSVKKLADVTGVTPRHIAEIANGNYAALPSAPYVRGYLIKLGEVLDFDGEAWWQKIKTERRVKNSGPTDALPKNRFLRKYPTKYVIGAIVVVVIIIFVIVQFPKIIGKPSLTITNPDPSQNPFTTSASTTAIEGAVQNASALSINGENVTISPTDTWQKEVTLSNGQNQFIITAKKFLGGTTEITEQIIYQPPTTQTVSAASSPSSTSSETPAR
jgi:cytoskeletal protein RodZ